MLLVAFIFDAVGLVLLLQRRKAFFEDEIVALKVTVRSYDVCPKLTDSEVHDFLIEREFSVLNCERVFRKNRNSKRNAEYQNDLK